jgi:hypothetical protein
MNSAPFLAFLSLPVLCACGGAAGGAESAAAVKCPEGQTFDGEFCQDDQSVATAEQPAPAESPETKPENSETAEKSPDSEGSVEEAAADPGAAESEEPAEPVTPLAERARATPVDVTMAAQAAPLIQYMAASHLPAGARQLGAPFAGQFAEGQVLERKVQLTQGKCYTVMAAGLPPIVEVDLELFEEGKEAPIAKDSTMGLQAVLGSREQCFSPLKTGPYQLVLSVPRGQGVAAAQVFQK